MPIRTICVAKPEQRERLEALVSLMQGIEVLAWVHPSDMQNEIRRVNPELVLASPELTLPKPVSHVRESLFRGYVPDVVALPVASGLEMRHRADVVRIQGEGGYARVICRKQASVLLSKSLCMCEPLFLPEQGFARVHRSSIVNMNYVQRILRGKSLRLLLSTGDVVDVGQQYREAMWAMIDTVGRTSNKRHYD